MEKKIATKIRKWEGGNETLSPRRERAIDTHSWLIYQVPPEW
jgi:hypothetical protein